MLGDDTGTIRAKSGSQLATARVQTNEFGHDPKYVSTERYRSIESRGMLKKIPTWRLPIMFFSKNYFDPVKKLPNFFSSL